MVMRMAQPAIPARPMRCRVRRPARSTTNSCGQTECQCHLHLEPPCPSRDSPLQLGKPHGTAETEGKMVPSPPWGLAWGSHSE